MHEEIDRLPDRHRLPVVLCDLEGLTYEQAASRLDWTVPALRCRLVEGRQRLRDRLSRRGVTGAALGVVIAASEATAAVPSAWAEAAVATATGGAGSAAVGRSDSGHPQGHAHDQVEDRRGGRPGGGRNRVGRGRRDRSGAA